jgi:hypothetical protein
MGDIPDAVYVENHVVVADLVDRSLEFADHGAKSFMGGFPA